MRKTKIITLIMLCLLLAVGCSGGEEVVEAPREEQAVEEIGQLVLPLGIDQELDLDLDGEQETLVVHHNEVRGASANVRYFVEAQLHERVSELPGLELTILIKDCRVIPDETQPVLVLYVAGKQENEVFFYALDEDMLFNYLGKIAGELDFFDMGDIELLDNQVSFDGMIFDLDNDLPSVPMMYQDKDEALDYLDLPVYSIRSGFGNPDLEEQDGTETKLTYLERDLEVFLEDDKITRICTSSGSLMGIDVMQPFIEEDWNANQRYELLDLETSAVDYKVARFDLDKHYMECTLEAKDQNLIVISVCVSLSELYQARVYEEHVLVDRFGNLVFAKNEATWTELLSSVDGWVDLTVLGYERENAVLFFQAIKNGSVAVYHYNLLDDQINKLVDNPVSAEFSGGMLTVYLTDVRKYFDLGGMDVTEEIMGPSEEEVNVEFYVQSDTLFYFPGQTEDYTVLKDLTEYLEKDHEAYETIFDKTHGLGFLEAYKDKRNRSYDLYLFLADEGQLKLLQEEVRRYAFEIINGQQLLLLMLEDDEQEYACYDLSGTFLGYCDQTGQFVE